jgi:cytochrome c553
MSSARHANASRNAAPRTQSKVAIAVLLTLAFAAVSPARSDDVPPGWAFPVNPPDFKLPPDDGQLKRVADSTLALPVAKTRDRFFAPDWHPDDHPPMPEIVARGRKPDVFACGFCHRADGPGGPENASLAGLPAAYIVQQMLDFSSGARKSSVSERVPPRLMIQIAKNVTDAEIQEAAAYFSALKPKPIVKVIETETVPKTFVAGWLLADLKTGEQEPIGARIIEIPEDLQQFDNRDARSRFIAYAPVASIEKGKTLAATGGPNAVPCGTCHGANLKGVGPIPGLAGRSPSYIVRQLYDFKHGARAGTESALMRPVVEKLAVGDMISLAVYAASLPP